MKPISCLSHPWLAIPVNLSHAEDGVSCPSHLGRNLVVNSSFFGLLLLLMYCTVIRSGETWKRGSLWAKNKRCQIFIFVFLRVNFVFVNISKKCIQSYLLSSSTVSQRDLQMEKNIYIHVSYSIRNMDVNVLFHLEVSLGNSWWWK